jgi:hypothetical protein
LIVPDDDIWCGSAPFYCMFRVSAMKIHTNCRFNYQNNYNNSTINNR